jgi:hypothetical protein
VKRALQVVFALLLAACGGREPIKSDWERQNEDKLSRDQAETEVVTQVPAFPQKANLLEFQVDGAGDFGFFVDKASLSVSSDGVVRYVLVARSPSGVENVSYEGLRCASVEFRRYALGRPDATWRASPGQWQPLTRRWHQVLHREFFCPQNVPLPTAAEGVRALELGGLPYSGGFSADPYRAR